jgi:acetyl-CoA carboxylase biotin carboxyl carrier protein
MNLTDDDVREILRLLESSEFDELHLATDRFKLTLRRGGPDGKSWTEERETLPKSTAATPDPASLDPAPLDAVPAPAAAPVSAKRTSGVPAAAPGNLIDVHPPLIGTFYRAPKPGAAPFVEVGTDVMETTVVGIVETMKLMNSVYAGARGKVVEICVANGQLVEPRDVLMHLAPRSA